MHAGTDPLTGRRLRFRQTVKTEKQAQIVLGRLLEQATAGQRPDSGVTVAELLARYMEVAELDVSTRETYEGYIRRTAAVEHDNQRRGQPARSPVAPCSAGTGAARHR